MDRSTVSIRFPDGTETQPIPVKEFSKRMNSIGHNSGSSNDKIRTYVERIEKGEQEKRDAATYVSGIYAELKAEGFDPKATKRLVRERAKDENKRREEQELYELYAAALGMEV